MIKHYKAFFYSDQNICRRIITLDKLLTDVLRFNKAGVESFVTGLPSSIKKQDITKEETSRLSLAPLKIQNNVYFSVEQVLLKYR